MTNKRKENLAITIQYNLATTIIGRVCIGGALVLLPEVVQAAAFNFTDAGVSLFDSPIKFIVGHYGKAVFVVGSAGAILMPGDLRTKAIGFGAGATLASLVMWAMKSGLGIVTA